ncbi:hypothetical protein [Aeromonas hydrophila]|uniref:hypothetical protein n=1 Tax=Aeromonas hydrophila TaxID=644 RepID=UPI0023608431|nr:hypothetical protein [Aeromonas hydrophila]
MSRPKSYVFALRSMKSNFNGNFDSFQSEVQRQRSDLRTRIGNGKILVNEWVSVNAIDFRTMGVDDSFLVVFEILNECEYKYKIVTSDDAHTIKNELLKNSLWFETSDGSPIENGR